MIQPLLVLGGDAGPWRATRIDAPIGETLPTVAAVDVRPGHDTPAAPGGWAIRTVVSNIRYANTEEVMALRAMQPGLARPEARAAAMIPIRKSAAWWDLPQDRRRAIFEETSHHTRIGMDYLPQVARRLHHCRDLGEPFDFVTWFEFAPEHEALFDDLLARLRATEEWRYVEREVDVRLLRV